MQPWPLLAFHSPSKNLSDAWPENTSDGESLKIKRSGKSWWDLSSPSCPRGPYGEQVYTDRLAKTAGSSKTIFKGSLPSKRTYHSLHLWRLKCSSSHCQRRCTLHYAELNSAVFFQYKAHQIHHFIIIIIEWQPSQFYHINRHTFLEFDVGIKYYSDDTDYEIPF